MKQKMFSLIELLVVIAIIGILAALMIPKFQNVEEDAKREVNKFNNAALVGLLNSYQAANKGYLPSRLHTGLDENGVLLENLPDIFKQQFSTTATIQNPVDGVETNVGLEIKTPAAQFRGSLTNAGIYELACGMDSQTTYKKTADGVPMIKVNGNLFGGKFGNSGNWDMRQCLKIGGMRLGEWVNDDIKISQIGEGKADDDEKFDVYVLFLGKDVQWGQIRNANGDIIRSSRVSIDGKTNGTANTSSFSYPMVFIQHFKTRPARVLGVISFNTTGTQFESITN